MRRLPNDMFENITRSDEVHKSKSWQDHVRLKSISANFQCRMPVNTSTKSVDNVMDDPALSNNCHK